MIKVAHHKQLYINNYYIKNYKQIKDLTTEIL
nr:MAG TPA: hypothetical protein [Caudoviricetes sp.]